MNTEKTIFPPRPPIGAPGDWHFPTPTRSYLDNGLEVVSYHLPGQHVIAAHLVLDIPLSAENRDLEGVATICARTLDEGSLRHGGEEYAELLENEGAGFGIDVSLSGLQAILDVPASRLEAALALFAEAVVEPALADDDVNRHVQLRLAEIEQAQANSAQQASIAFRSTIFDPESRTSRMNGGEPETVAKITGAAVRRFHLEHFGPVGTKLIMAGDLPADPLALAERYLGSWALPDQQTPQHLTAQPAPRQVKIIHRPGAVQADIRFGGFGIDRNDERWAPISVASYAMGGAFLSRLNAVLREEKGYTYGVGLNFSPMRTGGSFAVQGSFRTDVVADAIEEARQLLDITGRPFTPQEVDDAITFFTGVSPLRFATADGVADQAATQFLAALPEDYIDRSLAAQRAVTSESASAAYASLVRPDELSLVVVGDADQITEPLRAAGFTDLVVETPDGSRG
ncbi:pitrilysin family protein [Microlunatus panaciterrae]|uniref:Zn-dependent peptidase n=1 Tax=Microlunatus panaciterrae TaxID=400768 RepID=A0ABS2RHR0_9ACTN|nr:insulinase family protein [Microlunatus panaciterrae]MBM7797479.1 putative Zn-dependent peptidase [Microlunatus panaciterrae]